MFKKKGRRRLFATSGGGVRKVNVGPDGKITTAGRVGGNMPVPTYSDWADIASGYAKDPQKGAENLANNVINKLKDKLESNIKGKGNFTITFNPSDFSNNEDPIVPAFVENSKTKHVLANADDDRFVHKTVYHTGNKPTKAVLAAKKMNGSGYRVLTDSMIEYTTPEARNILTQRVGFNQKQYHIPPIASQLPMYLVKDLISYNKFVATEIKDAITTFSNVINIKQQFMIKNTSANFPMKFTIHLVKLKNTDYAPQSLNSLFVRTFYGEDDDLEDFATNKTGLVPKWLQHDPCVYEGGGNAQSARVLVSNKLTSLNKSSSFRAGAQLVESFSKVIPPGDFWNFSHVHHCGSGIDMQAIWRSTNASPSEAIDTAFGIQGDQAQMPFHYGIIFECQGKTAEAYSIPAENIVNSYIGSSPCNYSYEFKTSAYFAADALTVNNVQTPSTRIYEQSSSVNPFGQENDTREKFFLPTELSSNILTPIAANVGKAYVPMMSTSLISATSFEAGQDPG